MTRKTLTLNFTVPQPEQKQEAVRACWACRFFGEIDVGVGNCRRKTPYADPETHYAFWPEVGFDDWCGEFKRRQSGDA